MSVYYSGNFVSYDTKTIAHQMVYQLPIPKSSELFESIVCDLLNSLHNTTSFSLYGRNGQNQHGIDIISYERSIVCQCKLRKLDISVRQNKIGFVNEIIEDIKCILKLDGSFQKIIIATTIENDTFIQDQLNTITLLQGLTIRIEFWSWDYVSNNMFLFPTLVNKYYPLRNSGIELANIEVLNKSVYKRSAENNRLFEFRNIKKRNQLPVFDLSFINNTENTILLNSIDIYTHLLSTAKCGFYDKPIGILKVTKQFTVDLNQYSEFGEESKTIIEMENPIYAYPKSPFRIQIQGKSPIVGFRKVRFGFNFNSAVILTPELFFNDDNNIIGKIIPI